MRKNKSIDDTLRLQIIQEHLSGASKNSLAKKYNLDSGCRISKWMVIFGIENERSLSQVSMKHPKESEEVASLKKEVKELKLALAHEKMRAAAFDKMIDVAEEQFNLPIRKKAGTKQ